MNIYIKKGWKPNYEREIDEIFEEVCLRAQELYPSWFVDCTPELYIIKSTKSLGRCWTQTTKKYKKNSLEYNRDFNTNNIRYRRAIILLSEYILKNKAEVRQTLVHEFGHFVSFGCHHDYLWKTRSDKIGEKWGIEVSRLTYSPELSEISKEKSPYKYALKCVKCGHLWKYKRLCDAVKHPEKWRHNKCSSSEPLVTIKL